MPVRGTSACPDGGGGSLIRELRAFALGFLTPVLRIALALPLLWCVSLGPAHAQTPPGAVVVNTVRVDYDLQGAPQTGLATDQFAVEAPPVRLTLSAYGANGAPTLVGASQFSSSGGQGGPFSPMPAPPGPSGALDLNNPIPLVVVTGAHRGGALLIAVEDATANQDSAQRESIAVSVLVGSDVEFIQLVETDLNSGVFTGYVLTPNGAPPNAYDGALPVISGGSIVVSYVNPQDTALTATANLLLDPRGRVFDSATGGLIDGATVTIFDALTGAPAQVFGDDGVSAYPSSVISGAAVTDQSGVAYPAIPGAYRFPRLAPGNYRLVVSPPAGFAAPSAIAPSVLQGLPGAPFTIAADASYGLAFSVTSADVIVDIPIDPAFAGALRLRKTASVDVAAIGDIVLYRLDLEAASELAAAVTLVDRIPNGFSLVQGSVRVAGQIVTPAIAADGRSFSVPLGDIGAGQRLEISYALQVGLRAQRGHAINRAEATGAGGARSNVATAGLLIRDDMLRDMAFIVGRVRVDECPVRGTASPDYLGLQGVRLYLEDGTSVLTDHTGQFHFEAVSPGLHVVRLDESSLPAGYRLSPSLMTTRNAGRAHSAFVEIRPGALEQLDFCLTLLLRQTDVAASPLQLPIEPPDLVAAPTQATTPGFVSPDEGERLPLPVLSVGVAHAPGQRVELRLDDLPADPLAYEGEIEGAEGGLAISTWRGVHVSEGEHTLEALVYDEAGLRVARYTRSVTLPGRTAVANIDTARSTLIADGQTNPVIALIMRDTAGRLAREGERIGVRIDPPYLSEAQAQEIQAQPLTASAPGLEGDTISVGADGVALLRLAPAQQTGRIAIRVQIDGREIPLDAWLAPARQDWLVVGLAEAGIASTAEARNDPALQTHAFAENALDGGRLAFFARGPLGEDWRLTMAYDSRRDRDDAVGRLFQERPPDTHFPLYGDASRINREAETSGPLYARIERPNFFAMFGDFDTALNATELARYGRRMHGLQAVYDGADFDANLFASNARNSFQRDEFAGDGTSGPYRLSAAPLIINSERISIETRDRLQPSVVLGARVLARHLDYEIDYDRGVIQLRDTLGWTDGAFNPQIIVAEYESASPGELALHYGGRVAAQLANGHVELGASFVHEDGERTNGDVQSLDAIVRLSQSTRVVAEVAETTGSSALATSIRLESRTESYTARLSAQRQDENFGLGQQAAGRSGLETVEGAATIRLSETDSIALGFTQNSLGQSGHRRDFAEAAVQRRLDGLTTRFGLQSATDDGPDTGPLRSDLAFAEATFALFDDRLTLSALRAEPFAGDADNIDYPGRTALRANFAVTDNASVFAAQEWHEGAAFDGVLSRVGLTASPWTGGQITTATGFQRMESGERLMSNLGVSQTWRLGDNWSVSAAADARETLSGSAQSALPSQLRSADWIGEDYTAASLGVAHVNEEAGFSARLEGRKAATEDRMLLQVGSYDETRPTWGLANDFTLQASRTAFDDTFPLIRFRQGIAVRDGLRGRIVLYRLDFVYREAPAEYQQAADALLLRQFRVIGNGLFHFELTPEAELGLQFGLKLSNDELMGDEHSAVVGLVGGDLRYDIAPWLDIGVSGSVIALWPSGEMSGHLGLSLGMSPAESLWFSTGVNFVGYDDGDFAGGNYRSEGLFARFRFKFDDDTARSVLAR